MIATVPSEFDDFLAEPRNAVLCIPRGADGAPHATPVWFDYVDGRFDVSITRLRVKYRLLQGSSLVTLVVDDAPTHRTVVVSGRAEILDDGGSLLVLRKRLRAKYGYDFGESATDDEEVLRDLRREQRVVISITPEQVLSWAGD